MFKISKEYQDKIKKVKNHFGIKNQESYIWTELEELKEAYNEYVKALMALVPVHKVFKNLASEIADCYFMGIQIEREELVKNIIYGFIRNRFYGYRLEELLEAAKKEMYFKIDRTLERIATGYYDKKEMVKHIKAIHFGSNFQYIWEVPENLEISLGDTVTVETYIGEKLVQVVECFEAVASGRKKVLKKLEGF